MFQKKLIINKCNFVIAVKTQPTSRRGTAKIFDHNGVVVGRVVFENVCGVVGSTIFIKYNTNNHESSPGERQTAAARRGDASARGQ